VPDDLTQVAREDAPVPLDGRRPVPGQYQRAELSVPELHERRHLRLRFQRAVFCRVEPLGVPVLPLAANSVNTANPPASFSDQLGASPNDLYVRRMFWRSHLPETCAEVTASTLTNLQTRCTNAASLGGDPEACTAYVEAAELFVPGCGVPGISGTQFVGSIETSKCGSVGASQSGLPAAWSDPSLRWIDTQISGFVCKSPQLTAVEYCTGTTGAVGEFGTFNGGSPTADPRDTIVASILSQTFIPSACQSSGSSTNLLSTATRRVALVHTEGDPLRPTPELLVNAFDATTTETDGTQQNGICPISTTVASKAWEPSQLNPSLPTEWDV
jgi:hypothetical protein